MTASGQLGVIQQGQWQLGAPGNAPYSPPGMPTSARPWMAHLYNNDWSFRAPLGAIVGTRPVIQQTINGGLQPVTIELPTLNKTIQPGNLVVITEEGGDATGSAPAGQPIIGGTVEQVPDTLDVRGWKHEITITPFLGELGDAYLNHNYTAATDCAQMVRDAIAQTTHLRCTPISVPNTGVTAIYNFTYATCLDVINTARLVCGVNYSWHVDAIGVVWFQAINTNGKATFTVTPKDFSSLDSNGGDISGLKNFVLVTGGIPLGSTAPATVTYNNPTSQAQYGLRALNPPLNFPSCTDTTTLQAIANTCGAVFDRVIHNVTLTLPAYSQRILLGQPGGSTLRYFSPSKYSLTESEAGTGTYSSNYVVLDVQTDGIVQTVTVGDVPLTSVSDVQYQLDRIASRVGMAPNAQTAFVGPNIVNSNGTQNPTSSGARITLDGSVPMISVNDGTYLRAQMGSLASYTGPNGVNSPSQYGFRALDGSGNAIFDSMGLINTFQSLGISGAIGNQNFSSTTLATVTGSTVTFTLSRTGNLLIQGFLTGKVTAGVNNGVFNINLSGPSAVSNGVCYIGTANFITLFSYLRVINASPGVYTATFQAGIDVATGTLNVPGNSTVLEVLQFGA